MIPTSDQVHGNQDSTQCSQFGKHIVDLVVGVRHLDGDLSEIVGVRARQNLLVVVQVLSHGDQMILMKKRGQNLFTALNLESLLEYQKDIDPIHSPSGTLPKNNEKKCSTYNI